MTIELGWWLAPLAITLTSFFLAERSSPKSSGRDYGSIGDGLVGMFYHLLAALLSLSAWLIWALAT
jgi:hypothetical protein